MSLHPHEAKTPLTTDQRAEGAKIDYAPGNKVEITFPDGEKTLGKVIGFPFEYTNEVGKSIRMVPVSQDRPFWSKNVQLLNILVMDTFLKRK